MTKDSHYHSNTSKYVVGTFPFWGPRSAISQSGSRPGVLYTVMSWKKRRICELEKTISINISMRQNMCTKKFELFTMPWIFHYYDIYQQFLFAWFTWNSGIFCTRLLFLLENQRVKILKVKLVFKCKLERCM